MKRNTTTGAPDFYTFARGFLHTYMPTIRRLSPKTVEAYRISLECLLTFLTDREHVDRARVSFDHFDRTRLKAWMAWLADDKHYSARTITLRISAIKAFLAYAAAEDVSLMALSQAARTLKADPGGGVVEQDEERW
jgi:site-specific recombinase XerD